MKVKHLYYKDIEELDEDISICLGYFDGLHLGHFKIIKSALKKSELPIGILTFDKPLSTILNNGKSGEVLTSLDDRFRILSHYDIEYYFVLHVDNDFVKLSPLEFIEKILKKLHVKEVFVGEDYRFGKNHEGDISLLEKHFKVDVSSLIIKENKKISTQEIIRFIKDGDVRKAQEFLGRNYQVCGTVIEGHHVGKTIGFPTDNIKLSTSYVIPRYGVYKTIAYISGIPHISLTDVGVHPTVNEEAEPIIETHILNYNDEDYNKTIYLEFVDFIREERKFNSLEELENQIHLDIDRIKFM